MQVLLQRLFSARARGRWQHRYGRSMWRGWYPAWQSRMWGPYRGQQFRMTRCGEQAHGELERPGDPECQADRWL